MWASLLSAILATTAQNPPPLPWEDDPLHCIFRGRITYLNTVRDILMKRCLHCHSDEHDSVGYSNPDGFALSPVRADHFSDPDDAVANASDIALYVELGVMPPKTEPG